MVYPCVFPCFLGPGGGEGIARGLMLGGGWAHGRGLQVRVSLFSVVSRLSMPDDIAAAAAIGLLDGLDIYERRQQARAVGVIGWMNDEERYFDCSHLDRYISHASPLLPPLHCRATLLLNPRRLFS